jgi:hypothetical protein
LKDNNKQKGGDFMPVDFFEKEFTMVCERFNQTFGKQTVCNLKTRYRVIIAIIHMGMLNKKIGKTRDKYEVRDDIRMFIRVRNTLMTIFTNAEKVWQERRCYDNGNQADRRPGQRSNVG